MTGPSGIVVKDEPLAATGDWDRYVLSRDGAFCYHLSAWMRSVAKAYGHRCYWIAARRAGAAGMGGESDGRICGVLPLVHIRHRVFGNSIVSLPYADLGGVLADDAAVEAELLRHAAALREKAGAAIVELRSIDETAAGPGDGAGSRSSAWKVLMRRELPDDPERLFRDFKPKLRSQIRKPEKEGMRFLMGDASLLGDFYSVFCENMRDLGSPVHSREWFRAVTGEYGSRCRVGVVYRNEEPVAAGLVLACGNTLSIPWASSLRKYNVLSPNMMLYWNFLKYACETGFRRFDFGRCTAGSGTYRFKEQWGAAPTPICRTMIGTGRAAAERRVAEGVSAEGGIARRLALAVWMRIPVPVANLLGPNLRKYIPL